MGIKYEISLEDMNIKVINKITDKIVCIYEIYRVIDYDRFLVYRRDSSYKLQNLVIM